MRGFGLLVVLVLGAAAQEPAADRPAVDTLARRQQYLELNPYHERVFEDLVDAAVATGTLESLIREYAERCDREPGARAPRVLLARLLARHGEVEQALALLGPAHELEPLLLEARLLDQGGDVEAALAAYERALAVCPDDDARARVLRVLARAQYWAGRADAVRATLLQQIELAPADFSTRMEVAELFAESGLAPEALDAYRAAVELAGNDAERRCRALAALGRGLEAEQRGAEAVVVYEEALGLLARGHWLRAELFERLLEMRLLAGTLEPWLASIEAQGHHDVAAHLDLARVLERAGRLDEAVAVLADARAAFPSDEDLGAAILRVAARAERHDLALSEWQRRATARPADVGVQIGLSQALRQQGALEAADEALRRAEELANGAGQGGAALRSVAFAWSAAQKPAEAAQVLERAAVLDPTDLQPLLELARLAQEQGDTQAAEAALDRAEERARPEELLLVAHHWHAHGLLERALAALERAAQVPDLRGTALEQQAALLLEAQDPRARSVLRELADVATDAVRTSALERLADGLGTPEIEAWLRDERRRAELDPLSAVPLLAEAHLARRQQPADLELACARLRAYLALEPLDAHARSSLVDVLLRANRKDEALAELERLAAAEPGLREQQRLRQAELLASLGRSAEALAMLMTVQREGDRSPETLRKLASRYAALGRKDLSIAVLEQSLRAEPADAATALRLGRLLVESRQHARAARWFLEARRHAQDPALRREIAAQLHESRVAGGGREPDPTEPADLVRRVEENPYDREAPELALELLPLGHHYGELLRVLDALLLRHPSNETWLLGRARAHLALGHVEECVADVCRLAGHGRPYDESVKELLPELQWCSLPRAAAALGALVADPLPVALELRTAGYRQVAADFVRGFALEHGLGTGPVLDLLADLHALLRDDEFALSVLRALEERDGQSVVLTYRMGDLHHRLGHEAEVLACGRLLVELGAPESLVDTFYTRKGLASPVSQR